MLPTTSSERVSPVLALFFSGFAAGFFGRSGRSIFLFFFLRERAREDQRQRKGSGRRRLLRSIAAPHPRRRRLSACHGAAALAPSPSAALPPCHPPPRCGYGGPKPQNLGPVFELSRARRKQQSRLYLFPAGGIASHLPAASSCERLALGAAPAYGVHTFLPFRSGEKP